MKNPLKDLSDTSKIEKTIKQAINIKDVEKDVDGKSNKVVHKKQKALEHSITEGSAANFSAGMGNSYITPFALALNSNPFQIGLLSSFSGLASPLAQFFGSKLMETHSRKRIVMIFVLLQSLMWLPILALGYLFWQGLLVSYLPYLLITLFSILAIFGGIATPAWFTWMGDLVPEKDRGKYFSVRNRAVGAAGLIAVLLAALILDMFKTQGFVLLGFAVIFALAFTFRFISFLTFRKQYDPKFKLEKGYSFSFLSFIKKFDNYGKFSIYNLFFYFALMIASPFFAVYMLTDLGFSYTTFMFITLSSSLFYLLLTPLAGKFSDRFGNVKLLYTAQVFFVLYPIFWIFFENPLYLIIFPQLAGGIAMAAFTIASTNFTYAAVGPQHRGICIAYTSILIGIGVFLGSILGGALIKYIPITFMKPILFVFLLSASLRFLAGLLFLPKIKDEMHFKRLPPMHVHLAHPFKTLHSEIGWFKKGFK